MTIKTYYILVCNHMILEPERKGQKTFYKKVEKVSNKCFINSFAEAVKIKKDLDDRGAFRWEVKIMEVTIRG